MSEETVIVESSVHEKVIAMKGGRACWSRHLVRAHNRVQVLCVRQRVETEEVASSRFFHPAVAQE